MTFNSTMRIFARACLLALIFVTDDTKAQAPACLTAQMMDVDGIVTACCESARGGSCTDAFPVTCPHACARVVVPYVDSCGSTLELMPDDVFPSFHITG